MSLYKKSPAPKVVKIVESKPKSPSTASLKSSTDTIPPIDEEAVKIAKSEAACAIKARTRMASVTTNRNMNLGKMSAEEARQVQKVLPKNLVREVTTAMTNINFVGFEGRVRQLVIGLLEDPIKRMTSYDDLLTRMNTAIQRNIRRTHELDFVLQKYSRASSIVETFENRMREMNNEL